MSLAAALRALDDATLEAASSKGLLRRAGRDRDAGLAAAVRRGPDEAEVLADGETVLIGAGGLKAARCSCPASGPCRHILAAVLLLRDAPTPGDAADAAAEPSAGAPVPDALAELLAFAPEDLVSAFGRPALRDAELILAAAAGGGEPPSVAPGGANCTVRLPGQPEVRFLAGLGLAGAVSREPAPVRATTGRGKRVPMKALHAAAALAARRLAAGEALRPAPTVPDAAPPPARPGEAAFLDAVAVALGEAAHSALSTAPESLEERLEDLALSSRADSLPRLAAALRGVAADLPPRRARASAFAPAEALAAIARARALVAALRRAPDDPALRGAARRPTEALPEVEVVGCGLELWRTRSGARGATAHLLAPGQAIEDAAQGARWLTAGIARAAGQDPGFSPRAAVRTEPVLGVSLDRLARGAFRLSGARATAEGRLAAGGIARAVPGDLAGLAGLAGLLAARPDLAARDWAEAERRLRARLSPALRAGGGPAPILLRPAALAPPRFDALARRASLPAMDAAGRWLDLTLDDPPGSDGAARDGALDAAAALAAGPVPAALTALARVSGGALVLSLIACLPSGEAGPASLALWAGAPPRPDPDGGPVEGPVEDFVPAPGPDRATAGLLARADDEALALAELGGRMEDPARLARLAQLAGRLDAAGLAPLAALLARLAEAPEAERAERLLGFVHASRCHAALSARLPLVVPARGGPARDR